MANFSKYSMAMVPWAARGLGSLALRGLGAATAKPFLGGAGRLLGKLVAPAAAGGLGYLFGNRKGVAAGQQQGSGLGFLEGMSHANNQFQEMPFWRRLFSPGSALEPQIQQQYQMLSQQGLVPKMAAAAGGGKMLQWISQMLRRGKAAPPIGSLASVVQKSRPPLGNVVSHTMTPTSFATLPRPSVYQGAMAGSPGLQDLVKRVMHKSGGALPWGRAIVPELVGPGAGAGARWAGANFAGGRAAQYARVAGNPITGVTDRLAQFLSSKRVLGAGTGLGAGIAGIGEIANEHKNPNATGFLGHLRNVLAGGASVAGSLLGAGAGYRGAGILMPKLMGGLGVKSPAIMRLLGLSGALGGGMLGAQIGGLPGQLARQELPAAAVPPKTAFFNFAAKALPYVGRWLGAAPGRILGGAQMGGGWLSKAFGGKALGNSMMTAGRNRLYSAAAGLRAPLARAAGAFGRMAPWQQNSLKGLNWAGRNVALPVLGYGGMYTSGVQQGAQMGMQGAADYAANQLDELSNAKFMDRGRLAAGLLFKPDMLRNFSQQLRQLPKQYA